MRIAFVTVATKSYLAHVRTLCASLREHHPDPIFVLFADDIASFVDPASESFTTLQLHDVLPPEYSPLTFYYTAFELCCAVRPFLHAYLLSRTDLDAWIFLDSDILVTGSLEPVIEQVCTSGLLLSPHSVKPVERRHTHPVETTHLQYGIFNGGFLGVSRRDWTGDFLAWFRERLTTYCFESFRGMYVDQLWLNCIPIYFPDFGILTHPGTNVAYWNLHERVIARCARSGETTANAQPLLFVHFSHWRPQDPENVANGWPIADGTDRGVLGAIGRDYRDRLVGNGLSQCRSWPYGFGAYTDGSRIPVSARRKYYDDVMAGRTVTGESPFNSPNRYGRESRLKSWARTIKTGEPRH